MQGVHSSHFTLRLPGYGLIRLLAGSNQPSEDSPARL